MAFDFSTLAGYREDMTADEKLGLLANYEPPKPDYAGYIKKENFDRTASELAEWKKKHNALLSDEERKEAERLASESAIKAELEQLRKEKTISDSKSKYLAIGYDEKLAAETATAFANGDYDTVFKNQGLHIENIKKAAVAAALAGDPKPAPGSGKQDTPIDTLKKQYDEAIRRGDHVTAITIAEQIKTMNKKE